MQQLGVGSQGGAEALAIFHQLLYDGWAAGALTEPLARIKVDEQTCFGMIEYRKPPTSSWVAQIKITGAGDSRHAPQKNGGLADSRYMDDGDVMCHPILVPCYVQEFDVANAKVGAERNPQKTEVIHYVNDLDAALPEWRIRVVQLWPRSPR